MQYFTGDGTPSRNSVVVMDGMLHRTDSEGKLPLVDPAVLRGQTTSVTKDDGETTTATVETSIIVVPQTYLWTLGDRRPPADLDLWARAEFGGNRHSALAAYSAISVTRRKGDRERMDDWENAVRKAVREEAAVVTPESEETRYWALVRPSAGFEIMDVGAEIDCAGTCCTYFTKLPPAPGYQAFPLELGKTTVATFYVLNLERNAVYCCRIETALGLPDEEA